MVHGVSGFCFWYGGVFGWPFWVGYGLLRSHHFMVVVTSSGASVWIQCPFLGTATRV